jgi:hypothetical protein
MGPECEITGIIDKSRCFWLRLVVEIATALVSSNGLGRNRCNQYRQDESDETLQGSRFESDYSDPW